MTVRACEHVHRAMCKRRVRAGGAASASRVLAPRNVTTDELIDELKAIAGNDGARVNQVEGRETAAEYSRSHFSHPPKFLSHPRFHPVCVPASLVLPT